jgi:hypothetical protein
MNVYRVVTTAPTRDPITKVYIIVANTMKHALSITPVLAGHDFECITLEHNDVLVGP